MTAAVAAATLAGAPGAAAAGPYPPTGPCALSADAATLSSGGALTVSGSGLGPNLAVAIRLEPTEVPLGAGRTDDSGGFVVIVHVPALLRPGSYRLVATSAAASCQLPTSSGSAVPPSSAGAVPSSAVPSSAVPSSAGASSTGSAPAAPSPSSSAPAAVQPERASGPTSGPILLTLALIALLVLGGTWLMLLLTGRPRG